MRLQRGRGSAALSTISPAKVATASGRELRQPKKKQGKHGRNTSESPAWPVFAATRALNDASSTRRSMCPSHQAISFSLGSLREALIYSSTLCQSTRLNDATNLCCNEYTGIMPCRYDILHDIYIYYTVTCIECVNVNVFQRTSGAHPTYEEWAKSQRCQRY